MSERPTEKLSNEDTQNSVQSISSKPPSRFEKVLQNNKRWSETRLLADPLYFKKHLSSQAPKYLWIGCSDSRIPAEQIAGLNPGEVFVHRNIANQVPISDISVLSVIQYAVAVLKVKDIIIVGHYGCGGIRAAMKKTDHGPLETWLSHIRDTRIRFRKQLNKERQEDNENLLCELNVKQQVYDVGKIPVVQKAWLQENRQLRVHGLIYQLDNGRLKDLGLTISKIEEIPEQFWTHDI